MYWGVASLLRRLAVLSSPLKYKALIFLFKKNIPRYFKKINSSDSEHQILKTVTYDVELIVKSLLTFPAVIVKVKGSPSGSLACKHTVLPL